jgi:hypothetical protein
MKSMFGMCFNWKVLVGLGAIGIGLFVFAPGQAVAALPLLLLAACPLSMVVMALMMRGGHDHSSEGHFAPKASEPLSLITLICQSGRGFDQRNLPGG